MKRIGCKNSPRVFNACFSDISADDNSFRVITFPRTLFLIRFNEGPLCPKRDKFPTRTDFFLYKRIPAKEKRTEPLRVLPKTNFICFYFLFSCLTMNIILKLYCSIYYLSHLSIQCFILGFVCVANFVHFFTFLPLVLTGVKTTSWI